MREFSSCECQNALPGVLKEWLGPAGSGQGREGEGDRSVTAVRDRQYRVAPLKPVAVDCLPLDAGNHIAGRDARLRRPEVQQEVKVVISVNVLHGRMDSWSSRKLHGFHTHSCGVEEICRKNRNRDNTLIVEIDAVWKLSRLEVDVNAEERWGHGRRSDRWGGLRPGRRLRCGGR